MRISHKVIRLLVFFGFLLYSNGMNKDVEDLVQFIYEENADELIPQIDFILKENRRKIDQYSRQETSGDFPLDHSDSILITYGDQFRGQEEPDLRYLKKFINFLDGTVSGVHILPFFPYSSDDGFSIIDYRQVNPALGTWTDISAIASQVKLMVDLVLNHCSVKSGWFQSFLKGKEPYDEYFITIEPGTDLSMTARPRSLPLLTEFDTVNGKKQVWTTFSSDQADLNFANPRVFLDMLEVFLYYIGNGAQVIRLDAIAYLWKEPGTPSIHHPKTHGLVKLFRAVIEEAAPWVVIITETNVPHKDNVSYFGNGTDEAHLVYQFSLPPLVLDAFIRGDADHLSKWAANLELPGKRASFFNFLASHDGIGLLPAAGILSQAEIDEMIRVVKKRGGKISYKNAEGKNIPYEMNINYLSAVSETDLPLEIRAEKFLCSQAIMLAMPGVPGVYVHSLVGSQNWDKGVEQNGANRSINREKFRYDAVLRELSSPGSLRNLVYEGYKKLLTTRKNEAAFHPAAPFKVINGNKKEIFGILRGNQDGWVLCFHNITGTEQIFRCTDAPCEYPVKGVIDIVTGGTVSISPEKNEYGTGFTVKLAPYQVLWLKPR